MIPELQRRGLFRTAYEGRTLRENLGLPLPGQPLGRRPRAGAGRGVSSMTHADDVDLHRSSSRASGAAPAPASRGPAHRGRRARRGFLSRYGAADRLPRCSGRWRAARAGSTPRSSRRSTPSSRALWNGLAGGALLDDIAISLQRSGIAFAAAVALGIPLGLFMGQIAAVERALDPILQLFRQTSALALYPVFILLLGLGETSKVFVIFWATLFPLLLATIGGVKEVDRKLIEMAARLRRLAAHRLPPRRAAGARCRRSSSACACPPPRRCCC